ncbi:MAG TPA: ArsC family reductase [Chryseosolibacter sp.]|nr:ArsC family reductase [Chryseosolibacter sp.]
MAIVVYGIKNCNTVKSALQWLNDNKVEYQFHDYKAKGIEESKLKKWCAEVGWERLVNMRGTTWRQLDTIIREKVKDQTAAIALMKEKTSVIKRPLIESDNKIVALGFDPAVYEKALHRKA